MGMGTWQDKVCINTIPSKKPNSKVVMDIFKQEGVVDFYGRIQDVTRYSVMFRMGSKEVADEQTKGMTLLRYDLLPEMIDLLNEGKEYIENKLGLSSAPLKVKMNLVEK